MASKIDKLDQLPASDLVDLCREKGYKVTVEGNPLEFLSREALLGKLRSKPKSKKR